MAINGSVETIIAEAIQLPPDQRLTLAHRILSSVEPEGSPENDAAWDEESRERIARYDAGGVRASSQTRSSSAIGRSRFHWRAIWASRTRTTSAERSGGSCGTTPVRGPW